MEVNTVIYCLCLYFRRHHNATLVLNLNNDRLQGTAGGLKGHSASLLRFMVFLYYRFSIQVLLLRTFSYIVFS